MYAGVSMYERGEGAGEVTQDLAVGLRGRPGRENVGKTVGKGQDTGETVRIQCEV